MLRKILIVLPSDKAGGAEKVLKMIAEYYLSNFNIQIFFLQRSSSDFWNDLLTHKNIKLNYGKSYSNFFGLIYLIFFLIKSRKYYYIFSSQTLINGFLGLSLKLKIIKTKFFIARESTTVFNRFSGFKLNLYKLMYYLGYSSIDLLICQTQLMKEQFESNLPLISQKINIKTIPNPINISKAVIDQTEFTKNNEYIVAAGRLIDVKGFDILIDAFNLLKNDYTNLKLVILGEGHLREQLQAKIMKLNLSHKILLPGHVTNTLNYFKFAKACVISSKIEGFPNVILEMMSQNTNIISTKCAGGIDKLKGVFVVEIDDVNGLVYSLKNLLETDTSHNRKLFDNELKSRNIKNFIKKLNFFLNE